MGIFGIAVMTIYPNSVFDDSEALTEVAQRTRAAWDNRLEFYSATVLSGPRANRYEHVIMHGPQYAGQDWGAVRLSACVRSEQDWGHESRLFVEVVEA